MSRSRGRPGIAGPGAPLRAQVVALQQEVAEYKEALRRASEVIDRLIGETVVAQDRQHCACELLRYAGELSRRISERAERFPPPAFQLGDLTVPVSEEQTSGPD